MKFVLLFITLILWGLCVLCQNDRHSLNGRILEADAHQPLRGAAVILLRSQDTISSGISCLTDKEGRFSLLAIPAGNYLLSISFMGYQSRLLPLEYTPNEKSKTMGDIELKRSSIALTGIEIKQVMPAVRVKRDTLEYRASAFKTNPHDNLEQLMRKVPGIEVAPDGSIKINGVPVKTVLIDGHSYFGDDAKIASKYLLSGLVDRIQVIDRLPDFEDGQSSRATKSEKVLNLVIKKKQYNAWNGLSSAGFGPDQHYSSKLSLNHLKTDQQISIIAGANDINGFDQNLDPIGNNGVSKFWNGGLNYNQLISHKFSLESSYSISNNLLSLRSESLRRNIIADSGNISNQDMVASNRSRSHFATLNLSFQLDSSTRVTLRNQFGYSTTEKSQKSNYKSIGLDGYLMNAGNSLNSETGKDYRYGTQLVFSKSFKRIGQLLNINLDFGLTCLNTEPFNASTTKYLDNDGQAHADSFNLHNNQHNSGNTLQLRINYAHPIGRDQFLDFKYLYSTQSNLNMKQVYNFNPLVQHFDLINDSLSSTLRGRYQVQNLGVGYRKQKEQFDYSLGLNLLLNNQDTRIININRSADQRLTTILPYLVVNYNFNATHRLLFDYSSRVLPPTADQLLPVPDYSNPLLIRLGKLDLRPSRTEQFTLEYRSVNPTTSRSFLINLSAGFLRDKITEDISLDSIGRQFIRPVNVNGPFQGNVMLSSSLPIPRLHTLLNVNTLFNLAQELSLNNGVITHTRRLMAIQSMGLNYSHQQAWDIVFFGSAIYNGTWYTPFNQPEGNTLDFNFSLKTNLYLPLGFQFAAKANYYLNTGREAGYNTDQLILNFLASKQLFKKKAALQLVVYDVLNRSIAQFRSVGNNYTEDVKTNPLSRLGIMSFTWYFGKLE